MVDLLSCHDLLGHLPSLLQGDIDADDIFCAVCDDFTCTDVSAAANRQLPRSLALTHGLLQCLFRY